MLKKFIDSFYKLPELARYIVLFYVGFHLSERGIIYGVLLIDALFSLGVLPESAEVFAESPGYIPFLMAVLIGSIKGGFILARHYTKRTT